jgi:hypothetical protein
MLVLPRNRFSFGVATPVVRFLTFTHAVSAVGEAAAHDPFAIDPQRAAGLVTGDPISVWVEAMRVLTHDPDHSFNSQRAKIVAVQVWRR